MIASLNPRGIMSMASGVYMTLIRLRSTPAMVPVAHGRSGTAGRAPGLLDTEAILPLGSSSRYSP